MLSETAIHLKQKGLLCGLKGEHANVTPLTQEAPLMRLSVASLRRMVKRPLRVEFVHQQLTSYSGLELLGHFRSGCAWAVSGAARRPPATAPMNARRSIIGSL